MRRWLLPVQSAVLAVLVTWPTVTTLGTAAAGSPHADGAKHLWNLWWMRRHVWTEGVSLHTTLVNWPDGMDLWPIEPLNGLLALALPLAPLPLSNVLALLHVFLLGMCGGLLGRVVSRREDGALVTGALAQASAFTAFSLHVGVGELRQGWFLPLGLALAVLARERGGWRWFVLLGMVMGVATLSCFYLGFGLALGVAVYALATLQRRPQILARWAVAAVVSLAIVAVPVRVFATSYAPRANPDFMTFAVWMEAAARTPLETFAGAAVSPAELVTPRFLADVPGAPSAYAGGRYLGLVALLLAGAGVAANRHRATPWLFMLVPGVLLSLGSVLWVGGDVVTIGGTRIVLPLAWINRVLGYWAEPINFPARLLALPMICLAALASLAPRYRWTLLLVPLAVLDLLEGDTAPWPRETFTLPDVHGVEAAVGVGAVANLTAIATPGLAPASGPGKSVLNRMSPETRTRAIAAQLALDAPIEILPIERMEYWAPGGLVWLSVLPMAANLSDTGVGPEDLRESLWLLRDRGFDRLLLTHGEENGPHPHVVSVLASLGTPVRSPTATVWSIPEVSATEVEAREWRAAQEARAARTPVPMPGEETPGR